MYKQQQPSATTLNVNKGYQGETIEGKVRRLTQNKEPIKDVGELHYTERKDGVRPEYDIRTDRMEIALEAMDKASKSHIAKRGQSLGERAYENMNEEQKTEFHKKYPHSKKSIDAALKSSKGAGNDGGAESTHGK